MKLTLSEWNLIQTSIEAYVAEQSDIRAAAVLNKEHALARAAYVASERAQSLHDKIAVKLLA